MRSKDIRSKFLKFFEEKGHFIVPSAPIVLKDDPTLMFNNSGMAQFKEYFLGNSIPKSNRIADTQKCLRVSGKHNDLEDVGFDTYHHTMFEMLGNWSFGDYFKKEAIYWAWELLTEVYNIDKNILYVSVFEGSEEENVPFDQEAYDIWKELISEDRIILGNKKDNFWEMGDQGPCGPCSEIHVDIRSKEEKDLVSGRELVNADHPQVVEIWNNVFMEFNRKADGSLEKLPAQHVDTGMGFERLCMVLQNVKSNYDTDVFIPLIKKVEELTSIRYSTVDSEDSIKTNIAIRVIVDHVRAVSFAIADGQVPSNNGAGYVIRRILRRAIRYGFSFLNKKEPFINELVDVLSEEMGDFFPEIRTQMLLVKNVIREEEISFLKTLYKGLQLLDNVVSQTNTNMVTGTKVFELYDTFGFPKDLTALILKEKGMSFNEEEFNESMSIQRKKSQVASETSTDDWNIIIDGNIESFVGYDKLENEVKITRYRKVSNKKDGVLYQIVLDNTPFYPEGGGQVGDTGLLIFNDKSIEVLNTRKENNLILHITKELPYNIEGYFIASVNKENRYLSMCNHSATHLLQSTLKEVLGKHIEQKGSLVSPNYLRFDFSHFSKVSDIELEIIEDMVNKKISDSIDLIERRDVPFSLAIEEGATALFGEKYGDNVRIIKFGDSVELCGGTHVKNTSDIWYFKITSESSVATGIRRIEAITNKKSKEYFKLQENTLKDVSSLLRNTQDVVKSINTIQEDNIRLKKQNEELLSYKIDGIKNDLLSEIEEINGIRLLTKHLNIDNNSVKDLTYKIGDLFDNLLIVFAVIENDRPLLTCYISKDILESKGLNAVSIIKELGKYIQGGGGGQPFFATAGGKNINGINDALLKVREIIK